MKKLSLVLFAIAITAMLGSNVSAGTFMSDTFSYADGDLTVFDGTGANVSGGAWVPHSGTNFPIPIAVSGGQAVLAQGNPASEDANRKATAGGSRAIALGETWYYAALVTVNDTRTDPNLSLDQDSYFMHFKDAGSGFRGRAYLDDPSTGVGGAGFSFGLSATSGGIVSNTGDLNFGQQYKIVVSYAVDTGTSDLWVDPVDSSSPKITDTNSAGAFTLIDSLAMRQDFVSAGNTATVLVDSVALGNDFDSVLLNAMNGSNIPEPGSLALALLAFVGFAGSRRSL
ncbi:PEP-CTERM sorting domain-containing protein [Bythopirellula polymerisocia]|uniref:Ice-binding protein C-terminal domain-containing protein n=1 Tax=Bythopirellula polymerisocia TaxID=2528003 RepID=A0A5C6CZ26_9BACT|nr:PEP-CTERM sorting domain-containing protein [Bythopirellula polymerisocia]TWU28256.1 hypothetical protein Pla144_15430 [Bythopirellula polymerisocia]